MELQWVGGKPLHVRAGQETGLTLRSCIQLEFKVSWFSASLLWEFLQKIVLQLPDAFQPRARINVRSPELLESLQLLRTTLGYGMSGYVRAIRRV